MQRNRVVLKTVTHAENQETFIANVLINKQQSVSEMSASAGISPSSVRRILKMHKFYPYKLSLVQELNEGDYMIADLNFARTLWNCVTMML